VVAVVLFQASGGVRGQDDQMRLVYGLLLLVLMVSGFIARTRGQSRPAIVLRHAAIWLAIVAVLFAGYTLRDDVVAFGERMQAELLPARGVEISPRSISFRATVDGHFHVDAAVDGATVRFMVDTGATDVSLSRRDAERIGIDTDRLAYTLRVMTANGPARAAPVTLRQVRIGPITVRNVAASVSERRDDFSLLGMSYLRRLDSYTVTGNTLTLTGTP
jgi:aspartyl protease family protein